MALPPGATVRAQPELHVPGHRAHREHHAELGDAGRGQGLTLVHFSAQLERILRDRGEMGVCFGGPWQVTRVLRRIRGCLGCILCQKRLRLSRKVDQCKPLGTGTGAAVWESAVELASYVARTGAAKAVARHPLLGGGGSDGGGMDGGSRGLGAVEGSEAGVVEAAVAAEAALHIALGWWEGKVVMELGAGLGLSSVVAAHMGSVVYCTDGDPLVVGMCSVNVRANTETLAAQKQGGRDTSGVRMAPEVAKLYWGDQADFDAADDWLVGATADPTLDRSAPATPDVILLADVVYGVGPVRYCSKCPSIHWNPLFLKGTATL